ncbi:MAG: PQQ-dependent sugar dehydrogenase [Candidatus Spechtbacterales bacterium]
MKKAVLALFLIVFLSGIIWAGSFFWENFRGAGPALKPPPEDITELIEGSGENKTDFPLSLPGGFEMSVFAEGLPGVRVIVQDGLGNFWISQPSRGVVSLLEVDVNGEVARITQPFRGLKRPHGLAIDPQNGTMLYIAEEDKVSRVPLYTDASPETVVSLPTGGGHFTRTIGFGPDDRLYISAGSSCNVCVESDERRAAIYSMERDGSDFKKHAEGLRNAVFFTWSYIDGKMWATEMGRDNLGDDLPPDEINIIQEGAHYGWPYCYGRQIRDTSFMSASGFDCADTEPSYIDLQAHSAPLGLAFVPEEGWPEAMWYDLLVAYHGSWNRSEPTGYKIARFKLDENGNVEGTEDFISGWLSSEGALGRPVGILIRPGGIMYITDDHAGLVYKVIYNPNGE